MLKRCGWRWSSRLGSWYVPHSRDRAPKVAQIESTARQLRTAGFKVDVTIDPSPRCTAEVEASKAKRQAARVDALEAKAARARDSEGAAYVGFTTALSGLPEGGEPIKIGHHSEGRHRRAVARADRAWDKWSAAAEGMRQAVDAARAATGTTRARTSPITVANRIQRLEAELRKAQREQRQDLVAELTEQVGYWAAVRAQQIADGEVVAFEQAMISAGDEVLVSGVWWTVVRANPTTVTVANQGRSARAPYHSIRGHRPREAPA